LFSGLKPREIERRAGARFSSQDLLRAGRDVRRTFKRAGELFAREGAGPTAALWFTWKLNGRWLGVMLSLLFIVFLRFLW